MRIRWMTATAAAALVLAGVTGFAAPTSEAPDTADLSVLPIVADSQGTIRQPFRRVINVLNLGPAAVDDLSTTVTFSRTPSSVSFDRDTGDAQMACNWSGTTVTCHATHSASPDTQGAASSIQFLIVMPTAGTVTMIVTASSSRADPDHGNNTRRDVTTVTALPAARCRVPKLFGKTLPHARRALVAARCRLGGVGHRLSSTPLRGRVIAQRPNAGLRLKAGARVSVVIGRGPRR
jgi:PASTA domain